MYHVIEVVPVDESTLEAAINKGAEAGFELDRIEFIQQKGVRRPVMAYVVMVKRNVSDLRPESGPDLES